MIISREMIRRNWIAIFTVLLIGTSAVAAAVVAMGYYHANISSEEFRAYYIEENKIKVMAEVKNRVDEISYKRRNSWYIAQETIKHEVDEVYAHLKGVATKGDDPRTFSVGLAEGTWGDRYYLMDADGEILHLYGQESGITYGSEAEYAGMKASLLTAINTPDGVFFESWLNKPDASVQSKATVYALYLPEYQLIIATAFFHDEVVKALQSDIYKALQDYYVDDDNYVFVVGYDSLFRVAWTPEFVGDVADEFYIDTGEDLHTVMMRVIEEKGSGFVQYKYYKKGTEELISKTSYIEAIEDWEVYIGMGFYEDMLNEEIEAYQRNFMRHQWLTVGVIILTLLIVTVVLVFLIRRANRLQQSYDRSSESMFSYLVEISDGAVIIIDDQGKVAYENEYAKEMFGEKFESYIEDGQLEICDPDTSIYKVTNKDGKIYYVQTRLESINFEEHSSEILFLKDITDAYMMSSEFAHMAQIDSLSGLPNRRSMENYFNADRSHFKDMICVVAMIDIDHFKEVNDVYGHIIGDEVIKILAETFEKNMRKSDVLFRYGGEEFVAVLQDVPLKKAVEVIEKINHTFTQEVNQQLGVRCTFSAGALECPIDQIASHAQGIIEEADRCLYKAKKAGRNRIVASDKSSLASTSNQA